MPVELETFIIAMTPIGELRASIPFAVEIRQMGWVSAYFFSVVGNMVPVVLIFLFLDPVINFLRELSVHLNEAIDFLFEKTKKENEKKIEKWGFLALAGFTAIPLPISGAWTASLVAYLFGLDYKKSFITIFGGVLVAGLIVIALLIYGNVLESIGGIQVVIGFMVLGMFLYYLLKLNKKNV